MEDRDPQGGDKPPERFQPKVMIIWLVLIIAMVGLWLMQSPQDDSSRMTVAEVLKASEAGNIEKAIIKNDPTGGEEWYAIQGRLLKSKSESSRVNDI